MGKNTKEEIIELIKNKKMTPEEGFKLINNIIANAPVKACYKEEWQKKENSYEVKKESLLNDNIIIFDENTNLRNDIQIESSSRIILVKASQQYKKLNHNEYIINPSKQDDYRRFLNDANIKGSIDILHKWSKNIENNDFDNLLNISINSMFYLFKELLKLKDKKELKLLYLHEGVEIQPQFSSVGSFLKTINIENPNYLCKSISISNFKDSSNILHIILEELREFNQEDIEIYYDKNNERFVRRYNLYNTKKGSINKSVFKDNKVYIITGGAGGIGLIFAEYIVKRNKCNIVLTGRSALNKEKQEKINQIVKNGSQIIYIQSDVTKKDSVTNLIKEVKAKYKKINGVIHSAGVLRDSFFINKSKRDFDTVLFPKVYGTMWLDEATKNEQLDFFVTFSSIAGTLGNIGQTDYSYANSFMDYFIKKREQLVNKKRRFGKSISINWPLWNDGGMTIHENTVEWLKENLGLYPLTSKKGIEGFEDALQSNNNQLIVVEGELEKLNKLFAPQEKIEIDKNIEKSQIKNIDKKVLKEKVEEYIKSLLSEETKLPVSKIDTEVDFEKYGIDSVMVMNFNREMESFFGNISKTLFYENQTISELANYLIKKYEHKVIKKFGTNQVENSNKESKKKNVSNVSGRKNKKELLKKRKTNSSTGLDKYEITNNNHDDIAIVGLSGKYPMAENLDIFWENLKLGKDCITEIPSDRWDYSLYYDPDKNKKGKTYSKWGGFIEGADKFDPLFFNISPREARYVDPQERIFLQTAWHTLEDAGYTREKVSGVSIGVFVGVMFGHYQLYGVEESMKGNVIGLSSSYASIANRVSYCLNLKGPSLGIDSMCSSSLTAIHMAIQSILKGDCEVAIAGGVNVISHPNKYILLSQNNFPSTDGKCRSFGDGGDGYVPGEGTGAILLKPLKKAIIDNDRIYGVIKGSALNHGGKTSGYSVPNPNAQSSLISKVLKDANIDARTISYIEAHGTGTALGDPIEITGLVNAFEKDTNDKQYCSIGSVKSNIGHTESAAGIAGLTKILLQMKYKELIPSIHSSKLNTNISFNETPFFVQQKNENWKKPVIDGIIYPRRAGISSFGAGGSNAHIIIEEYNQNNRIIEQENSKQIVVVSAKNEDRLKEYVNSLLDYLNNEEVLLTDIAYTLSVGREAMTNRIAIITSTVKELKEKLTSYINNDEIDDFYIGDLSQQKNNILLKDNDSKEYIKSLIKTKSLNTLAKMWIEGKKVYWEELYKNGRIISLPTYPFAKERYWVPTLESSEEEIFIGESIGKLHPMVHRNTSTLEVQKFTTTLNGKEFFIEDHVIEGSNLLPGVAYIEMARIAGESSGLSTITKITNISFQRPIVIRDSICDVHICLYPNDNHIEYEVSTINGFGDSVVNSEGRIILENKIDNKDISVDINAIKDRCIRSISSYEIYEKFRKDKFNYGERLKPISNIYLGEGELISYLKLPDTVKLSSKEYGLHPTLFDGALQSVASLINNKDNIVFLPYSIGEVNIINHLNKDCFAHVICTVNEDDNKKFNIDVIDKDGKLIIRVKDFIVKARTKSISGKQNKNNNDLVDKKLNEDIFNGVERELLEKLQEDLIILVSKTLQIEQNKIDVKKDMSKYGFDSVTFTELGNIINRKFGLNVVPSTFYEHTTLLSVVKNFLMKYKETFKDYYINDLDEVINNSVSAKSEEPKKEVELLKPRQRYRSSAKNIKKYNEPIAIVGIGGVMPCSENLDEFWENLEQGKDLITEIPKDRWNWKEYYGDPTSEANKTNVKWGGFMKEVDKFDPLFFEISPREAELMDPQQRIFIETSWEAIEDAGYSVSSLSGSRTGVFVGVSTSDYSDLLKNHNIDIQAQIPTGISHSVIANRVSYLFNLHGPSEPINTACSSSLIAIHRAIEAIRYGNCKMAIAGGVSVIASPETYIALSKAGMICEDGRCKTFDKNANGYVRGEGSAAIVLKPLKDAIADNNHIYGVIKGSYINHGGHVNSLTTPNPNAQAEVINNAWKESGIDPSTIGYIEAHGSGTSLGDPIEINGLKKAFNKLYEEYDKEPETHYCGIGSVKTNIGHLEAAAGIAGLIKVLLSIKNKKIPASINIKEINPYLQLENSPFYIVDSMREWEVKNNEPRRAGVSSFGFGGANAHIVIEEYIDNNTKDTSNEEKQVIVLSAKNEKRLKEYAKKLVQFLSKYNGKDKIITNEQNIINNLENDLKNIAANIVNVSIEDMSVDETMDIYGFDPIKLAQLNNEISKKYDIDILMSQEYITLSKLIIYLYSTYKEIINKYYTHQTHQTNKIKEEVYINLKDLAYTLQVGRDAMQKRLAIIVSNIDELKERLNNYINDNNSLNMYIDEVNNGISFLDGEEGENFINTLIKENKLDKLAQIWVSGKDVNWNKLYNIKPNRISLPTYPFAKNSYWIQESKIKRIEPINFKRLKLKEVEAVKHVEVKEEVETLYYGSEWEKAEIIKNKNNDYSSNKLLIFDKDNNLANIIKNEVSEIILVRQGKEFEKINELEYIIDPINKEDYVKLIRSLKQDKKEPSHIIHSWSNEENISNNRIDIIKEHINISAYSLYGLCYSIIKEKLQHKVKIIYTYTSKENNLPEYEGISGLLKTACLENFKIKYKTINFDTKDVKKIWEVLHIELNEESTDVMYKDGQRFIKTIKELKVTKDKSLIKEKGVYIITGGLGGLGFIFAQYLAKKYNTRLVLTGRSKLDEAKKEKIKQLKDYGAQVIYIRGNISSKEEVDYLVQKTKEQYKVINGIIHSAGVIKDAYIINKSYKNIEDVISPKVYGTTLLDEATKEEKLDFFVMFSSIAAVLGNAGQSDYAYANSFMDSFARERSLMVREKERFGKSIAINYPLWQEGGMQLDSKIEKIIENNSGIKLLKTEVGIEAFELSLLQNNTNIMVIQGNKERVNSVFNKNKIQKLDSIQIIDVNEKDLIKKIQDDLTTIVSHILKIDKYEITTDNNMSEFGFDSLSFIEFANKLNETYKLQIIPSVFYEYSTLLSFANYLKEEYRELLINHYGKSLLTEVKVTQNNEITKTKPKAKLVRNFKDLSSKNKGSLNESVAIIGISGVMPKSNDLEEFWDNLEKGKDLIREIPEDRWDWKKIYGNPMREANKTNIKWGGFLNEVDKFDPLFFGISPREAELMDPQQRILLETVWQTIEDAGYSAKSMYGTNTGVFIGVGSSDYSDIIKENKIDIQAQISTGLSHSILTNRISYLLNLHGPSEPVDTACSSSLTAIHRAVESIQLGHCEMAIAGGVSIMISPMPYIALSKSGMLSPDGKCKTFDKDANGYVRGEGAGTLLLKSLSKAIKDKDNIYAVIKGSAINHGGHVNSLTTPNPNAQADVIVKAWEKAKIDPETITYIEAHGTGTSLGDPIEINGLKKAFNLLYKDWNKELKKKAYCGIGSVKTNVGHLEAGAGIAGILKVILSLKYKKIPASINLNELNPFIQLDNTPLYIVNSLKKWEKIDENIPRRAGISSFGYGGTNAHIVLEEFEVEKSNYYKTIEPEIIVLSAKNKERLLEYAKKIERYIEKNIACSNDNKSLKEMAYTLQNGRDTMNERLSIVASTYSELQQKLKKYINNTFSNIDGIFRGSINKTNDRLNIFNGEAGKEFIEKLVSNKETEKIAQLWVNGYELDWKQLHDNQVHYKISLPTYPFERESYWISLNNADKDIKLKHKSQYIQEQSLEIETLHKMDKNDLLKVLRKLEKAEIDVESAVTIARGGFYER